MNYSPQNQEGLLGLVAALKAGMDPSQAFGIVQYIDQQQAQQVANRQERLGSMADILTGAASGGMPFQGAQALAEAQPGPAGPAVQEMLSSLYPTADKPTSSYSSPIDTAGGRGGGYMPQQQVQQQPEFQQDQMSPVYQGPSVQDQAAQFQLQQQQMQAVQAQQQAAMEPGWAIFQQAMSQAKAKGMDPLTAYNTFVAHSPDNAMLVSSDAARAKGIMSATFGSGALSVAGIQPTG